ncbi:putative bifunctional diguanylate cyclase/phosphodiesterase [Desulfitobacterium sp. Sab5]|uniref:putative bifunctional diguanylate cyclase/phosphodiesterase n=1 Tax=Desulfitobacterium nosdiversum TaxID=3375356 RepID=UPI003CEC68E9
MERIKTLGISPNIKWVAHVFIICLIILPLFLDLPDGSFEIIWLVYFLPPVLIATFHGYKMGMLAGALCILLQVSFEFIEYLFDINYNVQNFRLVIAISGGIAAVTLNVGFLLRHLEQKQKELENLSQQLEFLANHDVLTALPNRRMFEQKLSETLLNAENSSKIAAIVFCDLDRFKYLNDTAGHAAGDVVISTVAHRVKQTIRTDDFLCRIGGDEFVLCINDITSLEDVKVIIQRILLTIELPIAFNTIEYKISASLGISIYPRDSKDPSALLRYADIAMYRSKARGSGNYTFFTPEMANALVRQSRIEANLRNAINQGQFILYYQPLFDIKTGKVIKAEALIRWNHPELGLVSPNEFIPLAEDTKLIIPIGKWVLRTAIKEAKKWHINGYPIKISINISSIQFQQNNCAQIIQEFLDEAKLDPQYLELEITERVALANPDSIIRKLNKLRSLGVQIAIDDFGTGYSSLSYLKKYPVQSVKIDRSFIQDITTSTCDRNMLEAMLIMAKNLDYSTVAEGVETSEQLSLLTQMGCDVAQGYLFSKPLPDDHFFDFLRRMLEKKESQLASYG